MASDTILKTYIHTYMHTFNGPFFQDNLGKPAPERYTILDFTEARDDGWQWHQLDHAQIIKFAPHFRQITTPVPHHSIFLRARCSS